MLLTPMSRFSIWPSMYQTILPVRRANPPRCHWHTTPSIPRPSGQLQKFSQPQPTRQLVETTAIRQNDPGWTKLCLIESLDVSIYTTAYLARNFAAVPGTLANPHSVMLSITGASDLPLLVSR